MATTGILLTTLVCVLSYSFASGDRLGSFTRTVDQTVKSDRSGLKTYIVHVSKPDTFDATEQDGFKSFYKSFLPSTTQSVSQDDHLVHSYQHVMFGFAAKLTNSEAESLEKNENVLSVRVVGSVSLHTTHTPSFLGLQQTLGVWKKSNSGSGVIIGVLDSGVLPTHPSFDDKDMPPPPAKWKGKCEFTSCNNKLIGGQNFDSFSSGKPPIDNDGHGTHTASTAGGAFVKGANVFGNANGTATGMAPNAHVAVYKVCAEDNCLESDILAGMDAAVEDGVDILSLSLGGDSLPFFQDPIALGAFAAVQRGIVVSCSAGNSGPVSSSMSNEAPWILTVGASTIDRSILSTVKLGNGEEYKGESLFQPKDFPATLLPLVFPGLSGSEEAALCTPGSLNRSEVAGKVVVCLKGGNIARITKGQTVKDAGGAAMILLNQEVDGFSIVTDAHGLPASHIGFADGEKIMAYINSSTAPTSTLEFRGTVIGGSTAPAVSSFSSRGPSIQTPGVLKPDIIGPGVSILAAWPFQLDNSSISTSTFNMISGTSMSCPHLSGIAALVKSAHPDWTPAAIKSAIMTSADMVNLANKPIVDQTLLPADLFATGSGHVNPSKANDPGLIYDIQPDDYLPFLCGLGYTDAQIEIIAQKKINCSNLTPITQGELNYPSFSVELGSQNATKTYSRTFTNVGKAISCYTLKIVPSPGVDVFSNIAGATFSALHQTVTYKVKFTRTGGTKNTYAQGYLKWFSDHYSVRSPIIVKFD